MSTYQFMAVLRFESSKNLITSGSPVACSQNYSPIVIKYAHIYTDIVLTLSGSQKRT